MPDMIDALRETDEFGRSPLHSAAADGDAAEVERLLAEGADRAQALAAPTLEKLYDRFGLLRRRPAPRRVAAAVLDGDVVDAGVGIHA